MRAAWCGKRPFGTASMNELTSPLALRPREAAKALGISPRLLWQLTKDGRIPCVRVGSGKRKTVLYPVAALQDWLARQTAKPEGGEQ
jgi:excisionase family DNA binding protein